jgi:protein-S-isoprenylcysteine O-methyltransferase Ste14
MDLEDDKRGTGLRFPPPLIPVAIIAAAYLLDRITPLPLGSSQHLWIAGIGLVVGAAMLAIAALFQFQRAKTHVEPWHPTTRIIQHGLFARSRNPIYLAFCVATAGIGLWLNSWWVLAGLTLQIYLLQRLVIRREEAYLEAKFGDSYRDYQRRVRRWL